LVVKEKGAKELPKILWSVSFFGHDPPSNRSSRFGCGFGAFTPRGRGNPGIEGLFFQALVFLVFNLFGMLEFRGRGKEVKCG
jgi:hypothetical protein